MVDIIPRFKLKHINSNKCIVLNEKKDREPQTRWADVNPTPATVSAQEIFAEHLEWNTTTPSPYSNNKFEYII